MRLAMANSVSERRGEKGWGEAGTADGSSGPGPGFSDDRAGCPFRRAARIRCRLALMSVPAYFAVEPPDRRRSPSGLAGAVVVRLPGHLNHLTHLRLFLGVVQEAAIRRRFFVGV